MNKKLFPSHFVRLPTKHTAIFLLGLLVAAQIVFSPIIDNFIESFLKSHVGIEVPGELKRLPFKSILIVWPFILSLVILLKFIKENMNWLIDKKEKIFVTSLLLSYQFSGFPLGRVDISDFAVFIIMFLWLIYIMTNEHYKFVWSNWYLLHLVLLLSILLSIVNGGAISLVVMFRAVFKAFAAFFIMVNMIRDRETVIFSLKMYLSLATFSAVIGIFQEIIFLYTGISLIGFISEGARIYMYDPTFLGKSLRVPAFTAWYLDLSFFLSTAFMTGVNLMLYSVFTGKKERLLLPVALFLIFTGLVLTFSYGSILIVLFTVVVSILIRWRSLIIYFIIIFLISLLLAYFSGFLTDFVEEPKKYIVTKDAATRIEFLRDGITGFINRHPLVGNGFVRGSQYISDVDGWNVHNNIVLVAAELGILGLFAYVALFFAAIGKQVVSILKLKNERDKAILLSLFISLIAFMVSLQVQSLYLNFFVFMYLGIVEAARKALSKP